MFQVKQDRAKSVHRLTQKPFGARKGGKKDCAAKPKLIGKAYDEVYWEAWEVKKKETTHPGGGDVFGLTVTNGLRTQGDFSQKGEAWFIEGAKLDKKVWKILFDNQGYHYTGPPGTDPTMDWWNTTGDMVVHSIAVSWNCCGGIKDTIEVDRTHKVYPYAVC